MEFIGYIALIGIGLILSLIGGGGSLLSVPILIYLFSLDVVTASSYSLFVVGTTSLIGARLKQKEQEIEVRSAIVFSVCSSVATFSTRKWLIPAIPEELFLFDNLPITKRMLFLCVFTGLVIMSSMAILLKGELSSPTHVRTKLQLLVPSGFGIGILAGFVGAGGGFLVLPSLILFGGLPFRIAIGTTLFVIGINSLLGFLGDVTIYEINWAFLFVITSLAAIGMLLGSLYSNSIPSERLQKSFGWIMLTIAVGILALELIL